MDFLPVYDMLTAKQEPTRNAKRTKEAPKPQLSEIEAQVMELKRLLNELEKVIQDQLKARP